MGQRSRAGQTSCTLFYPGRLRLPLSRARVVFSLAAFLFGFLAAQGQDGDPTCTQLLQAGDARAVAACKAQLDAAENGPATERMSRIVADDEYGVALLAVAHQPKQSLEPFDREIALLPAKHRQAGQPAVGGGILAPGHCLSATAPVGTSGRRSEDG